MAYWALRLGTHCENGYKGLLSQPCHLLHEICANSYGSLRGSDAHNLADLTQSDAHRCVTNLCLRLLRKQASRSLGSEYSPSYFAENTSFNIFGEEVDGLIVGLVKIISMQTDKTVK